MKVTVSINIEFEPSDEELCGNFRNVATEFRGGWKSLSDAVGQSISMLNVPRPVLVVARLMEELDIQPGPTLSGQMSEYAGKVVQAFDVVDDLVGKNAGSEKVMSALALI